MSRVRVKICGITRGVDLDAAVRAGADAIGFIVGVPSSPRNLSFDEAERLIRITPIFVDSVVVTVPESLGQLTTILDKLRPKALQVHGHGISDKSIRDVLPDTCLIRALQAESERVIDEAVGASDMFDAILMDSYASNKYGGTGEPHDWRLSGRVREAIGPKPLILSGGLNPENVQDAVRAVQPYAVDASSGVECKPGIKDAQKVFEFVRKAKGG